MNSREAMEVVTYLLADTEEGSAEGDALALALEALELQAKAEEYGFDLP